MIDCHHGIPSNLRCGACEEEEQTMTEHTTVDQILDQRGSRYGKFAEQAVITQEIKDIMRNTPHWRDLNDDMREALEMVALKIGRILNGDPNYDDSWVDIAGYAQLVADRLQGKER